jgi:acetate---CoA ligase (ADP-forming)
LEDEADSMLRQATSANPLSIAEPDYEADVLLADGSAAHVRAIRPEDANELVAFHGRLSPNSIVLRYFGPHPVLSEREVQHFTNVDGTDRVALVAERDNRIVAVARYDRDPGADEAEVAFLVDDAFQGKGVGTILLEHLVAIAGHHGIVRFIADTLSENHRMLSLLRDAGFARQYERSSGVIRVVLDIAPTHAALAAADERDRLAVIRSISRLLEPRSIAVVGASRSTSSIGQQLLRNLLSGNFEGAIYPVNTSAKYVASVPCWPTVEAIPEAVDLALIAVPASAVPEVVEECGRKGVGALVVISAGFAETGPEGVARQRQVTRLAHAYGMRVVGPNCFGVVNTDPAVSMNATFAPTTLVRGSVGFVSQSGGLGIALLREIAQRGLGISSFVSTGNKADISGNDLLRYWEQDPATGVILMYLESFGNPRKFSRIASRVSRSKPIVAVKSGRSAAGTRGAASHTAALASPEEAVDALFRKTGVVRVDTIEELFDVAEVLTGPLPRGRRVGIVTNVGGPGILAADACVGHGLQVPQLEARTQKALGESLAAGAGLQNPVDMIASATPEAYRVTLEVLMRSDEVDSLLVIFVPTLLTPAEEVAEAVASAVRAFAGTDEAKPVVACFLGAGELRALRRPGVSVPCFTYPETAARALASAVGYTRWLELPVGAEPVLERVDTDRARRIAQAGGAGWITGEEALALLDAYGIAVSPTVSVTSAEEAGSAASEIGPPVALKASGPSILHKSDVGGVRLGLSSQRTIEEAYARMKEAIGDEMEGAVVQKMIDTGVETIAGFVRDPAFGPLVLFGLGGTAVEVLDDHATRLAPLTDADARELVLSLRGARLLTGYRGSEPADIDALVDLVLRLGRLAEDLPELAEGDCNPVMAGPAGAVVVDARFRVQNVATEAGTEARHLS